MRSILVPVDFSECADEAVKMAMAIAEKSGAHIRFLHLYLDRSAVAHVPQAHPYQAHPIQDAVQGHIKGHLQDLVREAEKRGLKATPVLVYDRGNEKLEDYIGPYDVDLVIMGSHGATGIRERLIGSHAQYVVRHVPVPVLVVKKMPDVAVIKTIVLASAFHENLTGPLGKVIDFAKAWNAVISLLFVNLNDDLVDEARAKAIMKALADKFPQIVRSSNIIETNDEAWGISQFVQKYGIDMIAVSRYDHAGHVNAFSASIAELLVNHEHVPVLVV